MKDPFTWASLSRTHEQWLRAVGPQLKLNMSQLMIGEVLSSIIGDDANSFGFFFMPEISGGTKAHIMERMDWEIHVPETPEEIRHKLKEVLAFIQDLDFSKEENYSAGVSKWKEMRDWVNEEIEKRPEWKRAKTYSLEANRIWSTYWRDFVGRDYFGDLD